MTVYGGKFSMDSLPSLLVHFLGLPRYFLKVGRKHFSPRSGIGRQVEEC